MRNSTKVKLILLIFFVIFFGFLFWYFYQPSGQKLDDKNKNSDSGFNLFPFGDGKKPITDIDKREEKKPVITSGKYEKEKMPRLRQISKIPTAGVNMTAITKKELHELNVEKDIFDTEDAYKYSDHISEIRYVAKKNGNIYSTYTNTKKDIRVTNKTIPRVYESYFWDKNHLIARYLDRDKNIKTYSIELKKKSELELEEEKKQFGEDSKISIDKNLMNYSGVFLPMNIRDYSILPNSKEIMYLKRGDDGKTKFIISGNFGQDKKEIFSSELQEWNINWKNSKHVLLNSKASSETYSLSFDLDTKNGVSKKVGKVLLAGNGLPNYNFTKILYSGKDYKNIFHLYVYDIANYKLIDLGVQTLVEKCTWSKNNKDVYCAVPDGGLSSDEPDRWYKGYTNFSDSIYRIDTTEHTSELIFDAYGNNKSFDIINLRLDDFEDYIYFIDSITDFAWSYKLPEEEKNIQLPKATFDGSLGGGKKCSKDLILTENLKAGDRNGKYSKWAKKKITQAGILQKHLNRLGFSAGAVDGILGKNSDAAIKRMQEYLGTDQDGLVGPITRGLLNNSCE